MRIKLYILVVATFVLTVGALVLMFGASSVKQHTYESYSAFYEHEGELSGAGAVYCRDYCNQRILAMDLKSSSADLLDFKIRVIGGGEVEHSIDFIDGTVREIPDKNYQRILTIAQERGAIEAMKFFFREFGAVETDEMGEFNGFSCRYWKQEIFGAKYCYDENMILVHRHADYNGKVESETLTKLIVGHGGADALYEVPDGLRVIK